MPFFFVKLATFALFDINGCKLLDIYSNSPQNKMNLFVLSGHGIESFAVFLNGVILQKTTPYLCRHYDVIIESRVSFYSLNYIV